MKSNKIKKELENKLSKMNLNAPNKIADTIDEKLSILFNNMEYADYIQFIKNNKYLKMYDDMMGKYANNDTISNIMVKVMPDSIYQKILNVVESKIIELNLSQ